MMHQWKRLITAATILAAVALPGYAAAYHTSPRTYSNPYSYPSRYTSTAAPAATSSSVESTLLTLVNKERTSRGLRPLQLDSTAAAAAEAKSRDMVNNSYFSHTSPTYGSPAQLLSRYGVRYSMYGENIGKGANAARLHAMWMASSGHRANILNPSFTHVGIGAVSGSTGYTATQLFIGR